MKLLFHKNLEHHLVKNGFTVVSKNAERTFLSFRKFEIYIFPSEKTVMIFFKRRNFDLLVEGCETLHDLYRLEKLIEGNNNQK